MAGLAAAAIWFSRWQSCPLRSEDGHQQPEFSVAEQPGFLHERPNELRSEGFILQRARFVASRMHARFAILELDPMSSQMLSNMVLAPMSRYLNRLERLTDREILELERRDIAESAVFTDDAGQAFREILAKHGLTGTRTDHFQRLIMEINVNWHNFAPSPFQEDPSLGMELNAIARENHAKTSTMVERLRLNSLALEKEYFAGLNVDVHALFEDILALPVPDGLPPFHWPDDRR